MRMRVAAVTIALAMVGVACGQKPGVHQAVGDPGLDGSAVGATEPYVDPATGDIVDPATGQTIDPGTGTTGSGTGTTTGPSGTTGPTTGPGSGPSGDQPNQQDPGQQDPGQQQDDPPPGGGDKTGVSANQIVIGIHAPVTGAAPVRQDSFNTGRQQYWDFGNNGKPVTVHGRRVKVVFADDRYNPSTANSECQRMAEQENAFLLIGGAGTDQIKRCAQYAASRGIPYLSAGVTEIGLSGLGNYFGISMSYPAQAPLLAQYAKKTFPNLTRVAILASDTTNFDDAANALKQAFPGSTVFRPGKNARGTEWADDVCNATVKKFDIVIPLTSPTFFLELEGSAACNPQYIGVGLTMGVDTVPSVGCRTSTGSIEGSRFLNPFYAYHDAKTKNPDFISAGGKDDIQLALWGINKTVHELFEKVGPNLTREAFIQTTQGSAVKTGIFPDLNFQGGKRWGANQVHVVRAYCQGGGHYRTEAFFKSSF